MSRIRRDFPLRLLHRKGSARARKIELGFQAPIILRRQIAGSRRCLSAIPTPSKERFEVACRNRTGAPTSTNTKAHIRTLLYLSIQRHLVNARRVYPPSRYENRLIRVSDGLIQGARLHRAVDGSEQRAKREACRAAKMA